jgi:primosomal protein N' (replication factor Y)
MVGVISADTALLIPDFRSSERTFQLLCQVAGRAGRGSQPGQVIVQTFSPGHAAIQCASRHDHNTFAKAELRERRTLSYPPFGSMVRVVIEALDPAMGQDFAQETSETCKRWPEIRDGKVRLLGPAPCPIPMIKRFHRNHLLLLAASADTITGLLPRLPRRSDANLRAILDRDPVALL